MKKNTPGCKDNLFIKENQITALNQGFDWFKVWPFGSVDCFYYMKLI